MPGNELLGMPPIQSRRIDAAAGHRTGRGRKNEQYCDGDGGKRNLLPRTTILSSSPQSSNMDRTAWRSGSSSRSPSTQNMANVARPVHVNVLDMVFSAKTSETSRPHRE